MNWLRAGLQGWPVWPESRGRRSVWLLALLGVGILAGLLVVGRDLLGSEDLTWQAMQRRGSWRVGMDPSFPPFEMLDEAGQPVGLDVDLARAMAQEWGLELEIVSLGFDGLVDALLARKIDSVVSALPYDPRLTQDIAYSPPYFEAGVRLVVPQGSSIQGAQDLAGRRVAVEWGSAGDAVGRRLGREEPSIQLVLRPSPEEAVAALLAGDADALLIDGVTLRLAQARGAPIQAVGPPLESDPYVIAIPLDAPVLQERVRTTLEALRESGALARLETRWFVFPETTP